MRCLLIQDPAAETGAVALNIAVGSALDSKDLPGNAYFLKHMILQRSKKYPNNNEYIEYLKKHGGRINAFTTATDTNYHFECNDATF